MLWGPAIIAGPTVAVIWPPNARPGTERDGPG